ncbi:hypothetical protein SAMN02745127_01051 [Oceanospirillum multiglobuliferum]|uniref:UPF0260 protein BTE48_06700 n=1 Tax=Oceanospirillum multiglobuliferum TaxID=64969 RepID=A0A1T4N8W5_9GAMM|nr:YcgN family cysteine cluster protein [Oceanospirillum multiglobuliferum]OPX55877.1 hypothetical protein BTE48_06700 [Oceanospirillum multiglobuliferum]SJZ75585.1 hypothetical protein SAMN02745127_01051 [Oceanospirillum multiglobuliferum]
MSQTARFWETKTLQQLSTEEWESLCDGCAKCCLHKLEDDEDGTVYYTDVACELLDIMQCRCNDYPNRQTRIPSCIKLTPEHEEAFSWLPSTCAYRLVKDGQPLPEWHHLVSGKADSIHKARQSIRRRAISAQVVPEEEMELHIIGWVE